ncbi:MAG: MGMT family protein [Patescibacteria group bacterium]
MTTFTEQVKNVVKAIPAGSVLTYKEVAYKAGNAKAARAVANLMAKNYDLEIPCHRVIRSDGTLGGYNRGGIEKKRAILQTEGYKFK